MDVMDTMVHGSPSAPGLMSIWPPDKTPKLKLSTQNPHLTTHNGAMIRLRAAKEAERFRGPQADGGWIDEIDSWAPNRMPPADALALFEFGIRLGTDPRIVATSTPKRGRLVAKLRKRKDVVITRGRLYDNVENLAPRFVKAVIEQYGGTSLGQQEIDGELLEAVDGALIHLDDIADSRLDSAPELAEFSRISVAVDPSGSLGGDEKGITVGGRKKDHAYLLADLSTRKGPDQWGKIVVEAYVDYLADCVVAEKNYGGDMVRHVIHTAAEKLGVPPPPVRLVPATRGKHVRAQPAAVLYGQGRVHHCGTFTKLENQLTGFTDDGYEGEDSPDRGDAWVWNLYDLIIKKRGVTPSDLYGDELDEDAA